MVDEPFDVDDDGKVVLRLHVHAGAGRSEITGRHGDALKVRVAAPPTRGRANQACVQLVADAFQVKPSAVVVVAGETSRSKRVAISGVKPDELSEQIERVLRSNVRTPASVRRP